MSFWASCNVSAGSTGYEYVNAKMDGTIIDGPLVPLTYTQAVATAARQFLMLLGVGS